MRISRRAHYVHRNGFRWKAPLAYTRRVYSGSRSLARYLVMEKTQGAWIIVIR